jgi:hypothetical protein
MRVKLGNHNPSPATRFKKGCPGGPGYPRGKKKITSFTRQMTALEVSGIFDRLMKMTKTELEEYAKRPDITALDLTVARALIKGWMIGDMRNVNTLLERIIGKVPDKLEHTGAAGMPLVPPQIIFTGVDDCDKQGEDECVRL